MVQFELMITADLKNLTNLKPDDDDFAFYMKLKCCVCGTTTSADVCISLQDNFVTKKCVFCGGTGCIRLIDTTSTPLTRSGEFVPIKIFDFDKYEPVTYSFARGWSAQKLDGSMVRPVDFHANKFEEGNLKISNPAYQYLVVNPPLSWKKISVVEGWGAGSLKEERKSVRKGKEPRKEKGKAKLKSEMNMKIKKGIDKFLSS